MPLCLHLQLRKCHIAADAQKVQGTPWNVWTVETTVVPSPKPRIAMWRSNIWSLGLIVVDSQAIMPPCPSPAGSVSPGMRQGWGKHGRVNKWNVNKNLNDWSWYFAFSDLIILELHRKCGLESKPWNTFILDVYHLYHILPESETPDCTTTGSQMMGPLSLVFWGLVELLRGVDCHPVLKHGNPQLCSMIFHFKAVGWIMARRGISWWLWRCLARESSKYHCLILIDIACAYQLSIVGDL